MLEAAHVWGTLFLLFLSLHNKPSTRTFWKREVSSPLCGRSLFLVSCGKFPTFYQLQQCFLSCLTCCRTFKTLSQSSSCWVERNCVTASYWSAAVWQPAEFTVTFFGKMNKIKINLWSNNLSRQTLGTLWTLSTFLLGLLSCLCLEGGHWRSSDLGNWSPGAL